MLNGPFPTDTIGLAPEVVGDRVRPGRAAPKVWVLFLLSACAGLVVAALYVLVFVVVPTAGLPASGTWIFGAVFAVPVALLLCLSSALGALVGHVVSERSTGGVVVGSLIGGGLGVALIAGVGFAPAGIAFFAVAAVVQSVILAIAYRSTRSRVLPAEDHPNP